MTPDRLRHFKSLTGADCGTTAATDRLRQLRQFPLRGTALLTGAAVRQSNWRSRVDRAGIGQQGEGHGMALLARPLPSCVVWKFPAGK
jgi:hypothetical protein